MSENLSKPDVFCPAQGKRVPIWHCLGSFMQGRPSCRELEEAELNLREGWARVKCKGLPGSWGWKNDYTREELDEMSLNVQLRLLKEKYGMTVGGGHKSLTDLILKCQEAKKEDG